MTEKNYDVSFIAEAPKEQILHVTNGEPMTVTPVHPDGLIVFYGTQDDMEWLRHILWTEFHSKRAPWQKGEIIEVKDRARRMGFLEEAEQMEDDILSEFGPSKEEDL